MKRALFVRAMLALAPAIILVGCGGGGGDAGDSAAAPTSYWTMDSRTYVNGGSSSSSTTTTSGKPITVVVVSTATLSGGDASNGAYSGSSLSFIFENAGAGSYVVVPDRASLIALPIGTRAIVVECIVGIAVTTGSTQYVVSSGTVNVSIDAAGKPHFSAAGMSTVKANEVLGGVAGAPSSMTLVVVDAY